MGQQLEAMSDKAFRMTVEQLSQQLFDKYASESEKELPREEQLYDAKTWASLDGGKPN